MARFEKQHWLLLKKPLEPTQVSGFLSLHSAENMDVKEEFQSGEVYILMLH